MSVVLLADMLAVLSAVAFLRPWPIRATLLLVALGEAAVVLRLAAQALLVPGFGAVPPLCGLGSAAAVLGVAAGFRSGAGGLRRAGSWSWVVAGVVIVFLVGGRAGTALPPPVREPAFVGVSVLALGLLGAFRHRRHGWPLGMALALAADGVLLLDAGVAGAAGLPVLALLPPALAVAGVLVCVPEPTVP